MHEALSSRVDEGAQEIGAMRVAGQGPKLLRRMAGLLKRVTGSHHHYKHPIKSGIVTVPHPKKDIPLGTLKSVEKQARLKLR